MTDTQTPLDNLDLPQPTADTVDRIRYLIKLSRLTQNAFAQKIGVDPSNLSRVLSRQSRPGESLINRMVVNLGVSKNWLVDGREVPFPRKELSVKPKDDCAMGAPVYNIDVSAGCVPFSRMFTDERVIGYVNMPDVNPEYPIVRVSGDSMSPKIKSGCYIAIRPISLDTPIFWGQIYVVVLEDLRLVKYVRRHADPAKVILHSANPDYDDMEINRNQIVCLYLVESVLSYDIIA